ncbi:HTH-type transcriptional repressor DasR [Candidatus Hydrogenisulfobacillus filiaventi]|uniref:HTH-type transcriptional repressor DasR n=1 Tax=Candidatus Hydrogenisulfobacillus filiaventi TaxID=2707344 RepID=A0A6F8ZCR1_9FIRM|nr:HTH-type transcriptional repressor DasR [Candidatus Hydrogenisulfobacillus filiaventi]
MALDGQPGPGPALARLRDWIRTRIDQHELRPGDPLPSAEELAARLGISRTRVRAGLAELTAAGWLERIPGRGWRVAGPRLEERLSGLLSFSEALLLRGMAPGARLLGQRIAEADPQLAAIFKQPVSSPVWILRRLRTGDGLPLAVEETVIPLNFCPDPARFDPGGSLYRFLRENCGVPFGKATQTLEAARAPAAVAGPLEIRPGVPVFRLTRTTRDLLCRPFEYTVAWLRADRYRFVVELT